MHSSNSYSCCATGGGRLVRVVVDEEPVAAAYGLAHQGQFEMLSLASRVGWPKEARLVLMKQMMEDSCRRGDLQVMIPTTWGSLALRWRNETMPTCRFVSTPLTAWRVHALKTSRLLQEWLGKPQMSVGFYDEAWEDRRDESPVKLNVLA
ncbi:MAG: GNAT family N-acetyltransferase [Planctomycetaceae bacterium]